MRRLVMVVALIAGAVALWVFTRPSTSPAPAVLVEPAVQSGAALDAGDPAAVTPDCVMQVLANEKELEDLPNGPFASRPFVGPLRRALVCDHRKGSAFFVSVEQLSTLEVDAGIAFETGLENLKVQLKSLRFEPIGQTGVSTNQTDDAYAASILLIEQEWVALERDEGALLVAVPGRQKVFVGPRADPIERGLRKLAAEGFMAEPQPLTDSLFLRQDGGWQVLKP